MISERWRERRTPRERVLLCLLPDTAPGIAADLGIAPSSVLRSLYGLERKGAITRDPKRDRTGRRGCPALIWRSKKS